MQLESQARSLANGHKLRIRLDKTNKKDGHPVFLFILYPFSENDVGIIPFSLKINLSVLTVLIKKKLCYWAELGYKLDHMLFWAELRPII